MSKRIMYIGIDPGVITGYASIVDGKYLNIRQGSIITIMRDITTDLSAGIWDIRLHVENPNMRKYFGDTKRERLQGAGSIKRDYKIWTEFAAEYNIAIFPISPQSVGSNFDNETIFHAATGYPKKCGKHARDAAKIIFKFKK